MRMGMRNSPTVVQVAMYSCECRELTQCTALLNTSEPAVGRMRGGGNHRTVLSPFRFSCPGSGFSP